MNMLLKYESLILDSEERIMNILMSDHDEQLKVIELYNELVGKKDNCIPIDYSCPPHVRSTLRLKGIITLHNTLVFRVDASPENLVNHTWLCARRNSKTKDDVVHLKDINKICEYHQRKKLYYEVIHFLSMLLADYKVVDDDIVDIMDFDMSDVDKLRLIVLEKFYDRQDSGFDAEITLSEVMKTQQRLAAIIGEAVTHDTYDSHKVKAYVQALELAVQWVCREQTNNPNAMTSLQKVEREVEESAILIDTVRLDSEEDKYMFDWPCSKKVNPLVGMYSYWQASVSVPQHFVDALRNGHLIVSIHETLYVLADKEHARMLPVLALHDMKVYFKHYPDDDGIYHADACKLFDMDATTADGGTKIVFTFIPHGGVSAIVSKKECLSVTLSYWINDEWVDTIPPLEDGTSQISQISSLFVQKPEN